MPGVYVGMKGRFCFILLAGVSGVANAQRPIPAAMGAGSLHTGIQPSQYTETVARTMNLSGGEFYMKSNKKIGFDAVTVSTLKTTSDNIQKQNLSLSGFNVICYKAEGFTTKIYVSQGFNFRQNITKSSTREQSTFEGFSPVFSAGLGMEYTFSKFFELFARVRWMGGDITEKGADDFRYGQVVVHSGLSCKLNRL